jgi:hypothetical protein
MSEDWDNLLILDGCRYDTYAEMTDNPTSLERRTSCGSESWEFMTKNFHGEFHDTIYVTANPHATKLPDGTFFKLINLLEDQWDPGVATCPPKPVADAAVEALSDHPNKRLIVHFMQPHYPFIGPTGREINQSGVYADSASGDDRKPIWKRLRQRAVDVQTVQDAYRENLALVLEVVDELLSLIDGRTVVTSDHGNLWGERTWPIPTRGFGHPTGLRHANLLDVPWDVRTHSDRRCVEQEEPELTPDTDLETVTRRLEQLGYK